MRAFLVALLLLCGPASAQTVLGPVGLAAGATMGGVTVANLVCDGTTDNYALLTSLITTAQTTRANTIYFPPASSACMLSQAVTVPGGVHLWANPGSVTLKATTGNASTVVLLSMSGNTAGNNIYGLTFDGGGVDHTNAGNVTQVFNSSNVVFDHVRWQNTRGIAMLASTNLVNVGVKDSSLSNVGNHWVTTQLAADRIQGIAFCCTTTSTFTGTISGTTLTFPAVTTGTVLAGQVVTGSGVTANTTIVSGSGLSWTITPSQTTGPAAMTATRPASDNHGNYVTGTYFSNVGLDALSATQQKGFNAADNLFDWTNSQITATWQNPQPTAFGACIYGYGGDLEFNASSNVCNSPPGNGIDVAAGGATITGNYVTNAGQGGIGVFSPGVPSTTVITGNNIVNSYQWPSSVWKGGIVLSGAYDKITISGNVASDIQATKTQAYGLQVLAGSTFTELRVDPSNSFTGNVTAPIGGMIADYTTDGTKMNYILNPCFAVDQVNEGASYASGGGNRKIMDMWTATQSAGDWTTARAVQASNGCLTATVATITATKTPGAGDVYSFNQGIEGFSLQDLSYGTIYAQPLVLEFQAKTSCAGTYSVGLKNATGAVSYVSQYTLAANTLTPVTIVIPGDQAHAFANDNTYPLLVSWNLGSGSTSLTASLNSWIAGSFFGATTDTVFASCANANTFSLTGVRLYPGTAHVPWVQKSRAETLQELQRYYVKSFPDGTAPAQNTASALGAASGLAVTAAAGSGTWVQFPARMRTAPTITFYSTNAATTACWDATAVGAAGASSAVNTSVNGFMASCASGTTAADLLQVHWTADAR